MASCSDSFFRRSYSDFASNCFLFIDR